MATKKTAAAAPKKPIKPLKSVEFNEAAHHARVAKAAVAKPTKAPRDKAIDTLFDPHHVAAALGSPKKPTKRTVALPENGLSGVPIHTVRTVAELAKTLADFPRGSTFGADQYFGKGRIFIYNVRGKLIAEVRQGDKSAKAAKPKRTI